MIRGWCKKHHVPYVVWRGRYCSPLFMWGGWMAFFSDGIAYGANHASGDIVYYCGHWIVSKKRPHDSDFVEKVLNGSWPKANVVIVQPGDGGRYGVWDYLKDLRKGVLV